MKQNSIITTVLPLLLSLVLAASVVLALSSGAGVYSSTAERDRSGYENRVASGYIMTKVRHGNSPAEVTVEDFSGLDAIVIYGVGEEEGFLTRIYCYEGNLMELYTATVLSMRPADGEEILPLEGMSAEAGDGWVKFTLTHKNGEVTEHIVAVGGTR